MAGIQVGIRKLTSSPTLVVCFLLTAAYLLTQLWFPDGVEVIGFHVVADDVVFLSLGGAAVLRLARRGRLTALETTLTCLIALSIFDFVRSVPSAGTVAFLDFRGDMLALLTMLFLLEFETSLSRRTLALGLGVFSLAVMFMFSGRITGWLPPVENALGGNPLDEWAFRFVKLEALVPGFFAIVCFSLALSPPHRRAGLPYGAMGLLGFVFFIVCLQRTMTVAVICALALMVLLLMRDRITTGRQKILLLAGAAVLVGGLAVAYMSSAILQFFVLTATGSGNTFAWRVEGWQSLLGSMHWSDYIVGKGYGADMGRWTTNGWVTVQAHNLYVEKFWDLGAFGIALYLVLFGKMIEGLARVLRRTTDREERTVAILLASLLFASFVFSVSYMFVQATVVVFGLVLVFCRRVASKYPTNRELFRAWLRARQAAQRSGA